MESFIHPSVFGNLIRTERQRLNMNQVAFYNFLFPNNDKEEENIKKKMNNIENGKQKSVDFEMLLAICQKCDVSADYILGLKTDYRNQANEFVCCYTGLDENAVNYLHRWNDDKNNGADLSVIGEVYLEEDEQEVSKAYKKQSAIIFLRIINHLFKEGKLSSNNYRAHSDHFYNLRILHALYLMCMAKPKSITGMLLLDEDDTLQEYMLRDLLSPDNRHAITATKYVKLDGNKAVYMEDDSDVIYPISMKEILEQIAHRQLDRAIDDLIASVNQEESDS